MCSWTSCGRTPRRARQPRSCGYVSQLRKLLGADALETVGAGYRLCADSDDVDAEQFERMIAEGGRLVRAGDAGAAAALRDALSLWRGPPFGELAVEPFARAAAAPGGAPAGLP
jgi:hypothetical protein